MSNLHLLSTAKTGLFIPTPVLVLWAGLAVGFVIHAWLRWILSDFQGDDAIVGFGLPLVLLAAATGFVWQNV